LPEHLRVRQKCITFAAQNQRKAIMDNKTPKEEKKLNPVYEYLMKLRGHVFVNDPMLLV